MSKPAGQCGSPPSDATARNATIGGRWRFALVLLASLLVSAGQPLLSVILGDRESFEVSVTLLIMAVLFLASERRLWRHVATALGIIAFVSLWAAHWVGDGRFTTLIVTSHLLIACLFAVILSQIIRTILLGRASGDALLGAVCGYLLLGIIWSLVYSTVEAASPGSFAFQSHDGAQATAEANRRALGYYSFVTLSTVGFGDITPTTPFARTLSWLEAVAGQFYLAVLVAGLVGFKVSQTQNRSIESTAVEDRGG
jgi:hypothetical protein